MSDSNTAAYFLELIRASKRGKLKIYIGMCAGVGKTYRMLQEAHSLLKNGVDVKIAFVETHLRVETHALLNGLPIIPRRQLFYKGKLLEEMDLEGVLRIHPEVVIVDELAHSNIEGSKNEKRWQDVVQLLDAGINVISAVNIQHIESLNQEIKQITEVEVTERIPDAILQQANEVVNIDLTADELIDRLKQGKIYEPAKIETALKNFFQSAHILQLRELALKEVAHQVERKVIHEVSAVKLSPQRFLACVSSNAPRAKMIIRKTARLASYYDAKWFVLYVQAESEAGDKIDLSVQRHLINNLKLATELGAEVVKIKHNDVGYTIMSFAEQQQISTICLGKPIIEGFRGIKSAYFFTQLLKKLSSSPIDLILLS